MSNIFRLNWVNIISAVLSGVLSAILLYLANLANLSAFSFHTVEFTALTVGSASLLKAFLTDSQGSFLGAVPVVATSPVVVSPTGPVTTITQ